MIDRSQDHPKGTGKASLGIKTWPGVPEEGAAWVGQTFPEAPVSCRWCPLLTRAQGPEKTRKGVKLRLCKNLLTVEVIKKRQMDFKTNTQH